MSGRGYDRGYDRDDRDDRRGGGRGPRGGRDSRDRAPPTTLFVAGFPPNMRAKDLAFEFERMGPLIRCDIPALKSTSATPYAFVEFEDPRDADAAFRDMHGMRFGRHEISIQFAKNAPSANWRFDGPSRGPPPPSYGGRGGRDRDDRGSSRFDLPPPPPRPKLTAEEQEEADRAAEERARRRAALRRERSPEPRRDDDADYAEDRRSSSRRDDDAEREERHENGDSAAANGKDAEDAAAPKDEVVNETKDVNNVSEEKKGEENDGTAGWVSNE